MTAELIIMNDKKLEQDVTLSLINSIKNAGEGSFAVDKKIDVIATQIRHIG